MYKVLIVDDEEYIIKSLIRGIDWGRYGFEVIDGCSDGIDAYNEIMGLKPDLIFVDIRMPGMNGLELIKKVRESLKNIVFVIISGYAEFAYAQKALNYGAFGYCLKPFDNDEIHNILKKVREMLDMPGKNAEEDIISCLEEENDENLNKIDLFFRSRGIEIEKGATVLVTIGCKAPRPLNESGLIRLKTGSGKYLYFVDGRRTSDFNDPSWEKLLGRSTGIYGTIYTLKNIKKIIDEAFVLACQYFITGGTGLFKKNEFDGRTDEKLVIDFENALISMDIDEIKKKLNSLGESAKSSNINVKHAVNIYNAYVSFSARLLEEESYEDYIYSIDDLCRQFADIHEMFAYIIIAVCDIIIKRESASREEVKNEYFKRIMDYVRQNFNKEITIQSLSGDFTINPNYLSQLFRRELKVTFTDYITGLRINYARELLSKTGFTLEEIANKSGYTDYFYFIRVFKKVTGLSPGQYRKSNV